LGGEAGARETETGDLGQGKDDRIDCRVDRGTKERLSRAAELRGQNLSEFMLVAAKEAADAVLRDAEVLALTRRDSERFVAALLGESKPNEALRSAAEEYREAVASGRLQSR
jgi:uncharacterized protein (DUF1778 family)